MKIIKIINIAILASVMLLNANCFADIPDVDSSKTSASKTGNKSADNIYQKIIDNFYAYAGTIKPEIREEIKKYRIEIVEINKKKRELYSMLSQEAQNFLIQEDDYKKKLKLSTEASVEENNSATDIALKETVKDKKN